MNYNEAKDQLIFEGVPGNPAVLYRSKAPVAAGGDKGHEDHLLSAEPTSPPWTAANRLKDGSRTNAAAAPRVGSRRWGPFTGHTAPLPPAISKALGHQASHRG